MADKPKCEDKSYRVAGLPVGVLGESYVTLAVIPLGDRHYRCECFILTRVAKPHLVSESFTVTPDDVPQELHQELNEKFLFEEALHFAENLLLTRVADVAEQKQRPHILDYRFELIPMTHRPFLGCWMRGHFHEEIRSIAETTKCNRLKLYLTLTMQSRVMGT